jgi:hypothetical protein
VRFTHSQGVGSTCWLIDHNLSLYPAVMTVDSLYNIIVGDVAYPNANRVVVSFGIPVSGYAYLS